MIRAILAAGALACLTLAGAAEPAGAAAVALSRDKAGNETFSFSGTGRTGALENLPPELKKTAAAKPTSRPGRMQLITENCSHRCRRRESVCRAGYVPAARQSGPFPKNLAGPEPEESGERSVVFVRALIEDNE